MRNWRWWISRAFRQAADVRKQVWFLLNSQRDLLGEKALAELTGGLAAFDVAYAGATGRAAVTAAAESLDETAGRWLKPYPHAGARENIKEFLVSGVFILSVFTFFIQPMKIPSGSAQPTLFGNVVYDLKAAADPAVPGRLGRFVDWFRGFSYHEWKTDSEGELSIGPERRLLGFLRVLTFRVGTDTYTFWWPPDQLLGGCGVRPGQHFNQGDTVLRLKVRSGDRLFVDRFTYNFRRPTRGEIIVFSSVAIQPLLRKYHGQPLIANTHYIKRLIALGGERVQVGDDRHVRINGKRLDKTTPGFEAVYDFQGPPKDSVYSGHVNNRTANGQPVGEFFPDGNAEFTVRPDHYLAFGDNTMNSYDGRAWGDFPRYKVIGRAFFVFWPFSSRFGPVEWW
ncbi:MAG: signal peptidase I [Verrucomicrobiales bacterium]|nr:signal peptidase I [Verrucomicrobiales bacterium]MCP5526362.1 signal peptidase I [Verrucomicrobiales bacterium]